jgi:hypothetical protein
MGPPYFDFYDSFNAPIAHAQAKDVKPFEHEFERRLRKGAVKGRISLMWWFFTKYFYELTSRTAIACCILLLVVSLMSGVLPKYLSKAVISMTSKATGATVAKKQKEVYKNETAKNDIQTDNKMYSQSGDPEAYKKIKALEETISKLAADIDKLENQINNASALVLISDNSITLRGGFTYSPGDVIDAGPHKGKKFDSINWERRSATLNDGTILKLGSKTLGDNSE